MKKLLLVTAISSALLVGCGGGGDDAPVTEVQTQGNATRVLFDPSAGALPIPTNILLGGSVDGTLNIPVADPSDSSNPQVALNGLDGWGTHSTLTFSFSLPRDANGNEVSVTAASLEAPGSVRIFETIMGGSAVSAGCAAASPAASCAVAAELVHGTDFTVKATSNKGVAVIPLKPWKAKTGYAVVLTNRIQDSLGRDVQPSQTYGLMKRDAATAPISADASALGLQSLVNSHENALQAFGVNKDTIIYTSSFTTQSVDDVFQVIKGLMVQQYSTTGTPALAAQATGLTVADVLVNAQALTVDPTNPAYAAASTAAFYQGSVTLPYFLQVPTTENPRAPLTGRWTAACDSPASILGAIAAGAIDPATAGIDPAALANPALLLPPNACYDFPGVDNERHLTKYNPVPAVVSQQTIPVIMSVPNEAAINQVRAFQGLDPITRPANGWPVVIFQHGITGNKTNALGIAGSLSVAGFAMVAMDHPLHGDRGFGAINASTGSATAYMNLGSLLTARDNIRQSISDMLGLRLSLNGAQGAPIDGTKVYFIGHSLGAIAGTPFTAMANSPMSGALAPASGLFNVRASTLMAPGQSIANFLLASPAFGTTIKSQLLYAGDSSFAAAVNGAAESAGVTPGTAAFETLLGNVYTQFMASASAATVAQINGVFEQFAFAAQTAIDSADPINYAATVVANESAVHLIEVIPDLVVPNSVSGKPLAGTEPLIAGLRLANVTATTVAEAGETVSGAVRFCEGDHGSIVSPAASAAATIEMQMQAASWFATDARALAITNTDVVCATTQ